MWPKQKQNETSLLSESWDVAFQSRVYTTQSQLLAPDAGLIDGDGDAPSSSGTIT